MTDVEDPALDPDDVHHLERVLRLRAGAAVTVADGAGGWRRCTLSVGGRLEPAGDVIREPARDPVVTVAFAITKGERPELAVQKLTEVGVDRLVPFHAHRSVARWDGSRAERHLVRLRRVAREAAMQSRRAWLPEVTALAELADLLAVPGAVLADPDGDPPSLDRPLVVVGPEGGFTPEERSLAAATVRLGPHVLRAETAAIAAGTLLVALREGLVAPTSSGHEPP